MKLIIEAFLNHSDNKIPQKYTCLGEEISPGMTWEDVPEKTKSFAITMEAIDVPNRSTPLVLWIVYNISENVRKFKTNSVPENALIGTNDLGKTAYSGPCPEPGAKHHRYIVQLYALDAVVDLPAGATKHDLIHAMKNHILAEDRAIGTFDIYKK